MDFGSLYGNGAYFGPDWGADYLYRQGQLMRDDLARAQNLLSARCMSIAFSVYTEERSACIGCSQ